MHVYLRRVAFDLEDSDALKRSHAVQELGASRSRLAVPHLLPMLADRSTAVRLRVLAALRG